MEYFSPEDNRAFMTEFSMRDPSGVRAWFEGAKWAARMELFKYRNADTIGFDASPEIAAAGIQAMIDAMVREAHGMGASLIVLNIPYLPRGRVQTLPLALKRAVEGKDLTFVDFAPVAALFAEWGKRDPIGLYEEFLVVSGTAERSVLEKIENGVSEEVDRGAAEALESRETRLPPGASATEGVYAGQ